MYTHDRRGHKKVREGDEGKIASKSLAQKDKASKTKNKSSRFVWKKQLKFFLSLKKNSLTPPTTTSALCPICAPGILFSFFVEKKRKSQRWLRVKTTDAAPPPLLRSFLPHPSKQLLFHESLRLLNMRKQGPLRHKKSDYSNNKREKFTESTTTEKKELIKQRKSNRIDTK